MRPASGFTLIELLVAVAVLAILATLALPSFQGPMVRQQIVDSSTVINVGKNAVGAKWAATQKLPVDNADAGLPEADKLVGNHVSSITGRGGALHVVFGNQVNGAIKGKTLTLSPGGGRQRADGAGGLGVRPRGDARQDERQGQQPHRRRPEVPAAELPRQLTG